MRVDKVDLIAGLLVALFGGACLVGAFNYQIGNSARMGPGYLPMVLGGITLVLGLLIVVTSLTREGDLPSVSWRAMLAVLGAIGVFTLTLEHVGLIPTLFATVLVASLGDPDLRPLTAVALGISVALACWIIFILAIGISIPAVRSPF